MKSKPRRAPKAAFSAGKPRPASQRRRPSGRPTSHGAARLASRPPNRPPAQLVICHTRPGYARALHKSLADVDFAVTHAPADWPLGAYALAQPNGPQGVRWLQAMPAHQVASLAAVIHHEVPHEWPPVVLAEAARFGPFQWDANTAATEGRADWRHLPFVTVDDETAHDFDDAIHAAPAPHGFTLYVAIADVAHYVQPGTALDAEALLRGNSTYLPHFVVPMLPEALSNQLCSLTPHTLKPVLGFELHVSPDGKLLHHHITRAAIISHARLTYNQLEAAVVHGQPDATTRSLLPHLTHLLEAFQTLEAARTQRGALDLDLPETKLALNDAGDVASVGNRPRLTAHRIIEEFMITANVAAARALGNGHPGGVLRVHGAPPPEKRLALQQLLSPMGFVVPAPAAKPREWAQLVASMQRHPAAPVLLRMVLQSQQQARYAPADGLTVPEHYGLALTAYAHSTSPIRRYADLLTHRALLKLPAPKPAHLAAMAEAITLTERRSQQAEWAARDQLIAGFFQSAVGTTLSATITGVTPFGCFVQATLPSATQPQGAVAEGLLPKWHLPDHHYVGSQQAFRQQRPPKPTRSGSQSSSAGGPKAMQWLRVGTRLMVQLAVADPLAGRLTFALPAPE
jgi:ribonuclease R